MGRDVALANEILRGVVGSTALGTALEGTDDHDEMGVFIEPPEYVCGLKQLDHYIYRDQPEGMRSQAGDLDLTLYSLRKYCRLAAQGNPSVLILLYLPEHVIKTELGERLLDLRPAFVSRGAGERFLGYLVSQRMKLTGERSKTVNRPELVEKYGYDCYSDDTEFLTSRGWLLYDAISDGDALATINPATRAIEFQVPTERVAKDYDGAMIELRQRYSNCLVTPNHRMFVSPVNRGPSGRHGTGYREHDAAWQFLPAAEMLKRDWFHTQVRSAERTKEYPVTDPLLSLIGAYVSEGCVQKRRRDGSASVLVFTQNVGGRLEPFMNAVAGAYPVRSYAYAPRRPDQIHSVIYTLAHRAIAATVASECGEGSASKRLPAWSLELSTRQARLLLDALMAGDGTYRSVNDYRVYYTNSAGLAGDVQALALIAGFRANVWGPYETGMYQVMVTDGPMFQAVSVRANVTRHNPASRRIVCFTVPNETLVTRRNGRVAMHGNTKFAMHALRLGLEGIEYMTDGRLTLPTPEPDRSTLMAVRRGEVNFADALKLINETETRLRALVDADERRADMDAINRFLVEAHHDAWAVRRTQKKPGPEAGVRTELMTPAVKRAR